ncbi:MAG TPA: hypothetical protein VLH84_05810 [Patescibacteria group bacterium]|nr:hypothetical protein [Patescibacteria group bacterium]
MTERVQRIKEVRGMDGSLRRSTRVVETENDSQSTDTGAAHAQFTATRIVWYLDGIITVILGARFVLALLGANPANAFANFVYSISRPFVAPFFSLFSYRLEYGVSRFELYTLVAMAVYALVAYAITRLITINHPTDDSAS